jgi:hypothetical protein
MVQIGRPRLSLAQKKKVCRRWKEGQSISEKWKPHFIALAHRKPPPSGVRSVFGDWF